MRKGPQGNLMQIWYQIYVLEKRKKNGHMAVREEREQWMRKTTQRDIIRQDAMQVEEPTLAKMKDGPFQTRVEPKRLDTYLNQLPHMGFKSSVQIVNSLWIETMFLPNA